MAVRTVPPNAIRDKTGKKAVRPESLYQFERFVAPLSVLSDIGIPIRPALLVTRRKHCANALPCGACPLNCVSGVIVQWALCPRRV